MNTSKVYLVVDYSSSPTRLLKAFTEETMAESFFLDCEEHLAKKPKASYGGTGVDWRAYMDELQKWFEAHPAGADFSDSEKLEIWVCDLVLPTPR